MRHRIGGQGDGGNAGFQKPGRFALARCRAKRFVSGDLLQKSVMAKTKCAILGWFSPALALMACAAPKAIVVEADPSVPTQSAASNPEFPKSGEPDLPNDGIRLPDMLAMPGEGDFRSLRPNAGSEAGAVISRPPTDPPARPKRKAATSE
jgi:hypothetical protein